jgi:hypothetical protein
MIAKLRPILKRIAAESEQNSRKCLHYNANLRCSAIRAGTTISDSADGGSEPHELSWIKALTEKSDLLGPAMFEVLLRRRGRTRWQWQVCDRAGKIIMQGWEDSRPAAKYRAERALFLLLLTTRRGNF